MMTMVASQQSCYLQQLALNKWREGDAQLDEFLQSASHTRSLTVWNFIPFAKSNPTSMQYEVNYLSISHSIIIYHRYECYQSEGKIQTCSTWIRFGNHFIKGKREIFYALDIFEYLIHVLSIPEISWPFITTVELVHREWNSYRIGVFLFYLLLATLCIAITQ